MDSLKAGNAEVKHSEKHIKNELDMKSRISDAGLFLKTLREKIVGMCATFVVKTLHVGSPKCF